MNNIINQLFNDFDAYRENRDYYTKEERKLLIASFREMIKNNNKPLEI